MLSVITFVRQHPLLLAFGILLTFFSSFGQTFLISLYVPELARTFTLSNTKLSSLYAIGTMASAFSLPWVGRLIDTVSLSRFAAVTIVGLVLALLMLSVAFHPLVVLLAFFGLRLTGQALMGHTAVSTMARAVKERGTAISIASLGHPLGETVLPITITLLIGYLGWRATLQLSAVWCIAVVLPLAWWLIRYVPRHAKDPRYYTDADTSSANNSSATRKMSPWQLARERRFWLITPTVFVLGFMNTAIFFFQLQLGASKGWEASFVAGSLAAFATSSALALFFAGPLVDRIGARRVFPFFMLSYALGLILLGVSSVAAVYPVALFLMGLSNGAGKTIKNVLYADLYGTAIIGSVRSVFTTIMVISTALGPVTYGVLLDGGLSFSSVLLLSAGAVIFTVFWSLPVQQLK